MKNILIVLILFMTSFALGYTEIEMKDKQFGLNQASPNQMAKQELGTFSVQEKVHVLKAMYDFSIQGGAIGTGNLIDPVSRKSVSLPKGALVVDCVIDVITPGTTSASGTQALGTGQAGNDLKAALAAASYTGRVACVPVGTAATMIKLTADRVPTYTIATGALTAGKWIVLIYYIQSQTT